MNRRYTYLFFFIASIGLIYGSLSVMGRTSGTGITANTNAPSEGNCVGCHTGTALQTSSVATANLLHSTNFVGGGYFPDTTYNMTIAFKKTSTSKFGFSLTVLKESDDSPVGTLTAVNGNTQTGTAFVAGKTRTYISHVTGSTSSTSTDSIYWDFKWKAPSSDVGKVRFYAVINATNNNGQSSGDVIYAKEFSYGISSLVTVATVLNNDTTICANEPVTLRGSASNSPTGYEWKMSGGNPTSDTTQNSQVTYSTPGIKLITFRSKNQYGWSGPDTMRVTVKAAPVANIVNPGPITLCQGDSVELQASLQLNTQYTWLPGNQTGRTLWVKDSGTYRVQATNTLTNCITTSDSIQIKVIPKPSLTIVDVDMNDTVCNLFPVRYLIQTSTAYDSAQVFVNGNLEQTINMDTVSISPPVGDSFKVEIELYRNGCSSGLSNSITKYTLPTPQLPVASCGSIADSSITINWNAVPNVSGYEISRDSGKTWIVLGSGVLSHTFPELNKGMEIKFLVRSVSSTACPKSNNAEVVCKTTPCVKPFSHIIWKNRVCQDDEETLIVSGLSTNNYTILVNGVNQPKDSVVRFTLQGDSTLTISVVDLNQLECGKYEETRLISVKSRILAGYGIPPNDSFCKNELIVWNIIPKRPSISYEVFVARNEDSEIRLDSFTGSGTYTTPILADSQKYRLRMTEDVCVENINVPILYGVDNPSFTASSTSSWYYHTLKASDPNYIYTWTDSKGVQTDQSGDSVVYYLIAEKGQGQKFYVTGKSEFGCEKRDSVEFTVGDFLKVSQLQKDLKIYPNPGSNKIMYIDSRSQDNLEIEMRNTNGQWVKTISVHSGLNFIDMKGVAAGLYFLSDHKGQLIQKWVLE